MGKCRFWLSYTNQRGTGTGASLSGGDGVHVRGWDAGVQVTPRPRDRDEFDVSMTGGSHEAGRNIPLGTVKDTADGPRWEPAGKPEAPGRIPARIGSMEVIAAIPASPHENDPDPEEYICTVTTGTSYFAVIRLHRDGWVIPGEEENRYDGLSQAAAIREMIRQAGIPPTQKGN
jgi:hypothetical protein